MNGAAAPASAQGLHAQVAGNGARAPEAVNGARAPEAEHGAQAPGAEHVAAAAPVDPDLARAIAACESEPIHRPGAIQPHGVLLVLSPDGRAVEAASANVPGGEGAGLPDRLDAILGDDATARVIACCDGAGAGRPRLLLSGLAGRDGRIWTATLSPSANAAEPSLLELEPCEAGDDQVAIRGHEHVLLALDDATERLRAAPDMASACRVAVDAVRGMTGFARVMAYRFDHDWSGIVVAESLADPARIASFAGLRFPASDIPPQARALYRTDRVRVIPDATAAPVPVLSRDGAAGHDLARASLRAVSPVHLAYLANMGVHASMSVAVIGEDDVLWGLFACHHESGPLRPTPPVRLAASLLARALATRLAVLASEAGRDGRARVAGLRERIGVHVADPSVEIGDVLAPLGPPLADALGAAAFAILDGEHVLFAHGHDVAPGLAAALDRAAADAGAPDGTVATDRLDGLVPGAPADALAAAGIAGLLAHRLVDAGVDGGAIWAVWLRHERRHEVVWAGNPDKQPVRRADGLPVLTPRHSFSAWNEEVRGRSDPFTAADRAAASSLADAFSRALARRSAATARANRALKLRNEQIRFFADAAVHDLREPLWQIQVFAGMLKEDLAAGVAGEECASMAAIIESSAVRMRDLVDDLARYARAGADANRLQRSRLGTVIEAARSDLGERLAASEATLDVVLEPALALTCDADQLRRVFQNLLSNSVKYRKRGEPLHISLEAGHAAPGEIRIDYRDNGIGFDPAHAEAIFEPFRRLAQADEPGAPEGLGLGLAICRRIVEAHDGRITAEGSRGGGARFVIVLPEGGPSP